MNNKYGVCSRCKTDLIPIWFIEEEFRIESGIIYKQAGKEGQQIIQSGQVVLRKNALMIVLMDHGDDIR